MSTTPPPVTLRHHEANASVCFRWNGDRYDHSIEEPSGVIDSIGGRSQDAWPLSPPIQQLSVESIAGRDVALGVGAAGTSHWSLSLECVDGGFRFDWACRTKDTPGFLGTTYAASEAGASDPAESAQQPPADGRRTRITSVAFEPAEGSAAMELGGQTSLRPAETPAAAGTFRWSYLVRLG